MRISDWSSDVCSSDLLGGCRDVEVAVRVDHQLDVRADGRPDLRHQVLGILSALRRNLAVYVAAVVLAHLRPERVQLQRLVAELYLPLRKTGRVSCRVRVGRSV